MGLLDSVLRFEGGSIHVHPFYGWGWGRAGRDWPVPEPFTMTISSFWDHKGKRRGGIGRVREPGHDYDNFWVVFSTRHVGEYDFEAHMDKNGGFNLSLHEYEPNELREAWPVAQVSDNDIGGYSDIVATDQGYRCDICERMAGRIA